MADIKVSALNEATQSEITDSTLALAAVVDGNSSTGYASRKSAFSKIASYVLNTFSGLSLGGVTRTVKTAIDAIQTSVTSLVSKMGSTSISSIGDGTVTGAISSLNNDFANKGTTYTYSKSLAVSASTVATIQTVSIPTGKWLVLSYMRISTAGSSVYNHMLNSRVVRNTEVNGGGSVNWLLINGTASVNVQAYVSRDTTVENEVTIIRLD